MDLIAFDHILTLAAGGYLGNIGSAISVVLGLGAVIFFHELGHFAVAKWCDVHVERFSIGIGPIIWSRQKGETEYALSALPFGGYVKMLGQDDMDPNQMTSDEIAENPRAYSSKKVWQRMAIISAGVIMNVITGFLFFATAYFFGVVEQVQMIGSVEPGGPAWVAGIRPGDTIESIDGNEIQKFSEINQAVVLSSESIRVKGTHADGTPFDLVMQPRKSASDRTRRIGCNSTALAEFSMLAPEDQPCFLEGFPAENASQPFARGDRIVAINGEPVKYRHDINLLSARFASDPIVYTVERPVGHDTKLTSLPESIERETIEIEVAPQKTRTPGLWMAIGRVTVIADNSVAAACGLKLKDQIVNVDGMEVGKQIDPLTLPNYFASKAGEEVEVTVNRPREGDSVESLKLTITPTDKPGWSEFVGGWDAGKGELTQAVTRPLTIPSIGAGFHIQMRIAKLLDGSEAKESGKFSVGQKISKISLEHPDPKNITADQLGDKETAVLDFDALDGEANWAWAYHLIQRAPLRQVRIYVSGESGENESFAYLLKNKEYSDDLYLTQRGILINQQYSRLRLADGPGDAAGLGFRETKSSAINIYLTLRSLIRGDLSVSALSGPLGIINIGYRVANSGVTRLLMFLGFLSINLAVLNFLPIPVLDGGHMVFLIWEGVARRKPSPKVINAAHGVGLLFIISLFVFVLYLDIFVNRLGMGG